MVAERTDRFFHVTGNDNNEDNMSSWFGAYYTNDEPTRTGALVKAEESFLCEIYSLQTH